MVFQMRSVTSGSLDPNTSSALPLGGSRNIYEHYLHVSHFHLWGIFFFFAYQSIILEVKGKKSQYY